MTAARESVMRMVDLLIAEHGLAPVDAYMLCSVCADLRISEIVDMPKLGRLVLFPADRVRVTAERPHRSFPSKT